MSSAIPQPVSSELLRSVDQVIVLGEEAVLESVAGMAAPVTTWHTDEPFTRGIEGMERMRLVRDDLDRRVRALLEDLRVHRD